MDTDANPTGSTQTSSEPKKPRKRRRSDFDGLKKHITAPVYEHRYFKNEQGRSVQLRRLISLEPTEWEPMPSQKSSYSTFDSSRLTYARSGGLPSLGRKYAAGGR